jgi:hypothetical protein
MIKWTNLWHQFQLAPGTAKPRILLSLWQIWLMTAAGVGGVYFGWVGVAGGFAVAWISHELFFIAYAEKVVGLPELDQFPYSAPYSHPSYVPTIERWTGPFGSDPNNTQSG